MEQQSVKEKLALLKEAEKKKRQRQKEANKSSASSPTAAASKERKRDPEKQVAKENKIRKAIEKARAANKASAQKESQQPAHEPQKAATQPALKEDSKKEPLEKSNEEIKRLIIESETYYPKEWHEVYKKAQRSKKTTPLARKLKAGRFRLTKSKQIEPLPEMPTAAETAQSLLNKKWQLGEKE